MLSSITIKRNNHLLYHCKPSQKQEMLTHIISQYAGKSILVVVSNKDSFSFEDTKNITVKTDDEIMDVDVQQFDIIIHADFPAEASEYIKRLSCAKELSMGLILTEESQLLYQIETLLGRTILQKDLEGFEPVKAVEKELPKKNDRPFKNRPERDQKPRSDKRRQRNHHKDGTVRSEEERAEYQVRRAKSGKKNKPDNKKPFDQKKKYEKKEYADNKPAQPKRKPRTFQIKTSKKDSDK